MTRFSYGRAQPPLMLINCTSIFFPYRLLVAKRRYRDVEKKKKKTNRKPLKVTNCIALNGKTIIINVL